MTSKPSDERIDGGDDRGVAGDVHRALKGLGWLVPEGEAEVAAAEAEAGADATSLPPALRDADSVFVGGAQDAAPSALPPESEADEHLARAARDGGTMPPEIEAQMRRDRQAAEEELDRSDDGTAER